MKRYAVFTVTIKSLTDVSKNEKSALPIGFVMFSGSRNSFRSLSKDTEQVLRNKFTVAPNQIFAIEFVESKAHFRLDDGKALCSNRFKKYRQSPYQNIEGFVTCKNCLAKLEEKDL